MRFHGGDQVTSGLPKTRGKTVVGPAWANPGGLFGGKKTQFCRLHAIPGPTGTPFFIYETYSCWLTGLSTWCR